MPTATAPVAPTRSCPSAPMLNLPVASGIVNAKAQSTTGTHLCRVWMMPNLEENDVLSTDSNARNGSCPSRTTTRPPTTNASSTEAT